MMSLLRDRFDGQLGELMQRFSSSLQIDLQMLDEDNPWWYCNVCHAYWLELRIPE